MKERETTSTTENLEIVIDGESYHGQRVVLRVSDSETRQEIRYESLRDVDPKAYGPTDDVFMRAIAREILRDLVDQWRSAGSQQPVKGESRPGRRRRSKS